MTTEDLAAQRRIEQKWHEVEQLDYWGILGVRAGASDQELKQAYHTLAREWHVDAFSGTNLGPTGETLHQVFSRIAEAYEVLSDPKKRGEWEAALAIRASGMSTDVGALLDAESEFDKGRTLLERGEVKAAAKLFRKAFDVNPANATWRAHHMYSAWWETRNVKEAKDTAAALERLYKENPHLIDAVYFAARLLLEAGDLDRAGKLFNRVLSHQKNHNMANRDVRLLARKRDEVAKASRGFFGKLFGKK